MPKRKKTCEHCCACTKVTRSKGDVFVCWGVSEPFEIDDIKRPCRAYPDMKEEDFSEHWKDETDSARAEREAVEKQVGKKVRSVEFVEGMDDFTDELLKMGFNNTDEVLDFLRNSILLPHVEYDLTSINSCDVTIWYLDESGFLAKYEVPEGETEEEAKRKCLEMSGKRFRPSENFIRRTESRIEELEEECEGHYEEMDSMAERIDELEEEVRKLTAAGAKDKADLEEEAEDWRSVVDTMKNRPEYKQFHDELETEGFFTGTGLGTPDFGEVYKRYFAQKKTIEQYQKYAWELEKRLYEYEEKERKEK